jgi:phage-related minor tail protein
VIADVTGAQNGSASSLAALKAHHLSLAEAERITSLATQGNIADYNKLGIDVLPKTLTETQKVQEANQILADHFSGDAAAAAETFGGEIKALRAKFEDMFETLGLHVMPVLKTLLDFITAHMSVVETLAEIIGGVLVAALLYMAAAWVVATIAAMTFWTAATGGIIIAIVAIIVLVVKFHKQIVGALEDAWDDVKHGVTAAWDAIVGTGRISSTCSWSSLGPLA